MHDYKKHSGKVSLMFCLARQNFIAPFHWARLWHDNGLSYCYFHIYKLGYKLTKVKFILNYFAPPIF
jgi:hypothetical protein